MAPKKKMLSDFLTEFDTKNLPIGSNVLFQQQVRDNISQPFSWFFVSWCVKMVIPAVFAMHLAPIIIEFSVWATSQAWNSPTASIAMFGGLAMPTVHSHDPLPKIVPQLRFSYSKKCRINVTLYTAPPEHVLRFSYLEKVLLWNWQRTNGPHLIFCTRFSQWVRKRRDKLKPLVIYNSLNQRFFW